MNFGSKCFRTVSHRGLNSKYFRIVGMLCLSESDSLPLYYSHSHRQHISQWACSIPIKLYLFPLCQPLVQRILSTFAYKLFLNSRPLSLTENCVISTLELVLYLFKLIMKPFLCFNRSHNKTKISRINLYDIDNISYVCLQYPFVMYNHFLNNLHSAFSDSISFKVLQSSTRERRVLETDHKCLLSNKWR